MSYQAIDERIKHWAAQYDLRLATKYKDTEVRSVDVIGTGGKSKCQIWIDAPDRQGRIYVNIWNYKNRRIRYRTEYEDLSEVLQQAYAQAMDWLT